MWLAKTAPYWVVHSGTLPPAWPGTERTNILGLGYSTTGRLPIPRTTTATSSLVHKGLRPAISGCPPKTQNHKTDRIGLTLSGLYPIPPGDGLTLSGTYPFQLEQLLCKPLAQPPNTAQPRQLSTQGYLKINLPLPSSEKSKSSTLTVPSGNSH